MKKLLTILFLCAVLLSCEKDEQGPVKWILGDWKVEQYNYKDYTGNWYFKFTSDSLFLTRDDIPFNHPLLSGSYRITKNELYYNEITYFIYRFCDTDDKVVLLNDTEAIKLHKQ